MRVLAQASPLHVQSGHSKVLGLRTENIVAVPLVWNCTGLPEGFLLRVVVSYFLVLGCRFAYLSLYLGFWTEVVT